MSRLLEYLKRCDVIGLVVWMRHSSFLSRHSETLRLGHITVMVTQSDRNTAERQSATSDSYKCYRVGGVSVPHNYEAASYYTVESTSCSTLFESFVMHQ